MNDKFPVFNPESQTLDNYLELIKVSFTAAAITDTNRQVSIILTHIPTKYFDDVLALIAPRSVSSLTMAELTTFLKQLFKPKHTIVKSLSEFQDRSKLKTETYSNFYKDLNRLAELCDFSNKEEFLKYKLFLAARNEPFFTVKLADFDYATNTVGDLLTQLSNLEAAYIDASQATQSVKKIVPKSEKCKICGKNNHSSDKCKYQDATCHKCGKRGHISPVCRGKPNDQQNTSDNSKEKTNSKSKKSKSTVKNVSQPQDSDNSTSEGEDCS